MHDVPLIRTSTNKVCSDGNQSTAVLMLSALIRSIVQGMSKTHITPNTPAGPKPWLLGAEAAPQAAAVRTSKKYEHESMVPTNDTVAWDAGASRSQRKDMMVDLVREPLSPGHGDPCV